MVVFQYGAVVLFNIVGIEEDDISTGFVLFSISKSICAVMDFIAQLQILEQLEQYIFLSKYMNYNCQSIDITSHHQLKNPTSSWVLHLAYTLCFLLGRMKNMDMKTWVEMHPVTNILTMRASMEERSLEVAQ